MIHANPRHSTPSHFSLNETLIFDGQFAKAIFIITMITHTTKYSSIYLVSPSVKGLHKSLLLLAWHSYALNTQSSLFFVRLWKFNRLWNRVTKYVLASLFKKVVGSEREYLEHICVFSACYIWSIGFPVNQWAQHFLEMLKHAWLADILWKCSTQYIVSVSWITSMVGNQLACWYETHD